MNYEKKYKEALERMKSWANGEHPECFSEAQKAAEFIFPELKESEDERIRKSLINFLKSPFVNITDKKVAPWIAWLEKQGEKTVLAKYVPELKESEDEKIRKELIAIYSVGAKVNAKTGDIPDRDIVAWLEKQNKQSSSNIPSRETILAIWELGNDWKELTNGSISTEYGTQLEYIQNHWQESSYYDNIMEGNERK